MGNSASLRLGCSGGCCDVGPTSTKVRRMSSSEDVAGYDQQAQRSQSSWSAPSPSPPSHHQPPAQTERVPLHSGDASSYAVVVSPRPLVSAGDRNDASPPQLHHPPSSSSSSSCDTSSDGDYEMPCEQEQEEQQAAPSAHFFGADDGHGYGQAPSPAPRILNRSPSGARVGDISLQQRCQTSWDRPSSSDDDDDGDGYGGPAHNSRGARCTHRSAPIVGPQRTVGYGHVFQGGNEEVDDDGYEGPSEDAPAAFVTS